MTHAVQDFEIHAGDDLTINLKVTEDGTPTGTPVDLTGASVIWAVATRDEAETRLLTLESDTTAEIEITDPVQGEVEIKLSAAQTLPLEDPAGDRFLRHQCRVTDSGGDKTTVMAGRLTVHPTILGANE